MRLSGQFQAKQTAFTPLEIFVHIKMLPLLFSVCLILFHWLIFAYECFFYTKNKTFSKKKKEKSRLEIVLITSLYYTTNVIYSRVVRQT